MTTTELQTGPGARPENVLVHDWRYEQLRQAGYDDAAAAELAERADVDLHLAVQLLEGGCEPEIALRILR